MRCRAARKRLSAYTDGALALYEMVALKEHLSGCAACRHELQALRQLNRLLAERASPAPAINWRAFGAALAKRLERQRVDIWALPWYRQAKVRRVVVASAAAVLIMVGVGVLLNAWLQPSLVKPPPLPDTTLRYESRGPIRTAAWEMPWHPPAPADRTPPTAPLDGESLRMAWLAGTDQAWENDDATLVSVRYDDPRGGEPVERHYVFHPVPQ